VILLISNRDHGKIKTGPGACVGPPCFNFSEAAEISYILTGSVDIRYPCPLPSSFHLRDKQNTADDHRKLTSDGAAWQCLKRYQLAAWSLGAGNLVKLYHCVQLACSACWSSFSEWLAGHALGLQAKSPDPHFASLFLV
jgi:hypothetical protein